MARIIYSGLVQSINGSIGGTTFQRNAYGFTVKAKPNIVNPNRQRQANRKANLQYVSLLWRQLSQAQRDTWNTYATTNPTPSRRNPNSYLTGQALFTRMNLIRLALGVSDFPTCNIFSTAAVVPATIEIKRVGGQLIYFNDTDTLEPQMNTYCALSAPIPQSRNYDRSEVRTMGFFANALADQVDITAAYQAQFGVLPTVGQFVFVKSVYWVSTGAQVIEYPPERYQVV